MNIQKLIFSIAYVTLIFIYPVAASYQLKDLLEADKRIAQTTPSLLISKMTGEFLNVKGIRYQIRQFVFEANPIEDPQKKSVTFSQLINQYEQLLETPKQAPGVLYPVAYFMSTTQMKEDGFYYLLSLRETKD